MFRGRAVHTIDSKNRMSLPAGFRAELQRRSDLPPMLTTGRHCLELHPNEDWKRFEERITAKAAINPNAQAIVRYLMSNAIECPIDKQGRILVPQYLREKAGLERDVTVAGVGPKIELWDSARFEANLIETQARYEELSKSLEEKPGN
jgi:MraZ protein